VSLSASPNLGKLFRAATRRWLGPFADTRTIVKVTVRDQEFHIVRELTAAHDLAAFRELWSGMTEVDAKSWPPAATRTHYKLDVQWSGRDGRLHSSRWLYHPGGFVNLVAIWPAIWVAPLYRMATADALEITFDLDSL
jgi:hypothetical protein